MIYPVRILILIIIFLSFCKQDHTQKLAPKAIKGVLDLTQWDFEKDGTINLDGEWEFYWEEFMPPNLRPMQWQKEGYPADGEKNTERNFLEGGLCSLGVEQILY